MASKRTQLPTLCRSVRLEGGAFSKYSIVWFSSAQLQLDTETWVYLVARGSCIISYNGPNQRKAETYECGVTPTSGSGRLAAACPRDGFLE